MPNHTPEHMLLIAQKSASTRRATKIAGLIQTAPPLSEEDTERLLELLRNAKTL